LDNEALLPFLSGQKRNDYLIKNLCKVANWLLLNSFQKHFQYEQSRRTHNLMRHFRKPLKTIDKQS